MKLDTNARDIRVHRPNPSILALYYLKSAGFIQIWSGAIFSDCIVLSLALVSIITHNNAALLMTTWVMFSLDFALEWIQITCMFNSTMQYTELAVCLFSFLLLLSLIRRVFTRDCIAATCLGVVLLHTATAFCFTPTECQRDKSNAANQSQTIQHSHRTGF